MKWLPDMDSNHDKEIQNLLCYRYTIWHRREADGKKSALGVKATD